MTQDLLERTVRDWVAGNPGRGARELNRLGAPGPLSSAASADELANALIQLAGRMELAETRAW